MARRTAHGAPHRTAQPVVAQRHPHACLIFGPSQTPTGLHIGRLLSPPRARAILHAAAPLAR